MGRLEDVVARNAHHQRRTTRTLVWVAAIVAAIILLVVLMLFTDLGMPKRPPAVEKHVDGVLLRSPGR